MLEYATLGQIVDQVGRQIQDSSSTKQTAIKEWANTHYQQLARNHRWPQLTRVAEERNSLTAGQSYLYLPNEVEQVYVIFAAPSSEVLQGAALDTLIEQFSANYNIASNTVAFAEAGEVGYSTDFYTSGETLTITHNGSAAVSGVVHGLITATEGVMTGVELTETVSILPSTGVVTSNTYFDLIGVSVADLSSGVVVTVSGTTSLRTYAKIAYGQRTAKYKRIRLMQPTAAAGAYTLVWKKRVLRLVEDHQALEIPVGQAIIDMIVATMLSGQREYGAAGMHQQRAESEVERLKASVSTDGAIIHQATPVVNLRRGYHAGGGY